MKPNEQNTKTVQSIRLPILERDRDRARTLSQQHSNTLAQYNSYLNHVCLTTFLEWFKDWIPEDLKCHVESQESWSNMWEFVNGTVIHLAETRIVLIPCDDLESETFEIPQEWIDIPNWNGDYYLPIEVSLGGEDEDCWIEIFGFTTHRQIKANRKYDANARTYAIDRKDLIENLEVMLKTMELNVKAEVPALPTLVAAEAKKFIEELGKRSIYSPRQHLPFEKWGALLENEAYRQQLFDLRMGKVVAEAVEEATPIKKAIDLRNWLQNIAEKTLSSLSDIHENWESYENLFSEQTYSVAFRSRETVITSLEDNIENLIALLSPEQPVDRRAYAAKMLGNVGSGNSQAIQALSDLLQNDKQLDAITRVQAILSLQKLGGNTLVGFQANAKLIDLGLNLEEFKVALIIATIPLQNNRLEVGICLKSMNTSVKLPPKIKVSVLKKTGEPISGLEIETRSEDDIVEMSTFSFKQGTQFRVQVLFKDVKFSEDFIA